MIGTTRRERSSGRRATIAAAASTTTSGALSGCSRPANITTSASRAIPTRSRATPWSPGEKTVRSTPGLMIRTRSGSGVVQVDELLALGRRVRDDQVGGLDDLLLTDHPSRRLGLVAGRRAARS